MSYGKPPAPAKYARTVAGSMPGEIAYTNIKKEKKMGFFKRKFAQWVREAWENARNENRTYATEGLVHEGVTGKSSVRFTIYAASGGHIIEYYKHDRYKEHDGPELVIVRQGDELGKAVEHIITLEALRS